MSGKVAFPLDGSGGMLDATPYPKDTSTIRQKPMQVLCLGLSRTGTMSLYLALGKLGYTSYHMVECGRNAPSGAQRDWNNAVQAKLAGKPTLKTAQDFDRMLWRYDAVSDIPCVLFADEILEAYPDAKVVLTERDIEGWLKSVERSFYEILSWRVWSFLQLVDRSWATNYIPLLIGALRVWTGDDWQNRDKLRKGFRHHYQHMREIVPKERLLEYHAREGWEPLCNFLGKPVPTEAFPRVNEGLWVADLHQKIVIGRFIELTGSLLKALLPVAVVFGGWWAYSRYGSCA